MGRVVHVVRSFVEIRARVGTLPEIGHQLNNECKNGQKPRS